MNSEALRFTPAHPPTHSPPYAHRTTPPMDPQEKSLDSHIIKNTPNLLYFTSTTPVRVNFAPWTYGSYGTYGSHGSHGSHGTHGSHGAHGAHGSHGTRGSHRSHGTHGTHGSHGSHGTHGTHGSHVSHGIHGSHGAHVSHGRPIPPTPDPHYPLILALPPPRPPFPRPQSGPQIRPDLAWDQFFFGGGDEIVKCAESIVFYR